MSGETFFTFENVILFFLWRWFASLDTAGLVQDTIMPRRDKDLRIDSMTKPNRDSDFLSNNFYWC